MVRRAARTAAALALAAGMALTGACSSGGAGQGVRTSAPASTTATAGTTAPSPRVTTGPAAPARLVPAPTSLRPGGENFEIRPGTVIRVPGATAETRRIAEQLAGVLRPSTGYPLPVSSAAGPDGIVLRLSGGDPALGDEGYRLAANGPMVTVDAPRPAGLFHGVQTLRQLLPPAVERDSVQRGPWRIPGGTITDTPRYRYRGAMLDVARHFFTVPQVERYIDQLALYKINTLHLHLTDDQGWRIAVDSWPRLTTRGASTETGGGPGGFYSKNDYRTLVAYAASRYLTVVPEIDMPGHTNAALASYASLNCNGVAPPLYTGTQVGFSSLCVSKAITYRFADDVIREVAALTPGPYLHIGGDEAKSTSHADYTRFMDRVQPMVARRGKTVIAWHQLAGARPAKGAIAQYWGVDGSEKDVAAAARAGTRLILSPASHAYLDMKYNAASPVGTEWAGYVDVRKSYSWNPASFVKGAPASAVLGVEAPLWTDTVRTTAAADFLAFPRLAGIAELGWSPASTHNWNGYKVRLAAQGPRWTALGIRYYRSAQVPWPNR